MAKVRINAEKDTWQYLRLASDHSFELAELSVDKEADDIVDRPDPLVEGMKALLCRVVALEGFVNSVGSEKCPSHWWVASDRKTVKEKIELIAAELSIKVDFTKMPFCEWARVRRFRDAMSHPRRTTGEMVADISAPSKAGALTSVAVVEWERECTFPQLKKNIEAIDEMIKDLARKTNFKAQPMGRARGSIIKK